MKFSEQWLRKWVNPPISTEQMSEQLSLAGLEVDSIEPVAGAFSHVVVGEVIRCEQHPDADRLRVCHVNIGDEELTIVCGGANVRTGLKVAVATIGATLPGDFKIKKSKLRGVESHGMLCSASELGLAQTSAGILELPADAPIAADLRDYLQLNDVSIDIDLTPNRGDCASVLGVAREVAAINDMKLVKEMVAHVKATIKDSLPISISAEQGCARYVGRIIKGIKTEIASPIWLTEKLRRSGIRSIHPVVDVTNYVMLELGIPMHAFDLAKIKGGIHVRYAQAGEGLLLLDGKTQTLDDESLVISDDEKALALAGIMGGEYSAVTESTTDLFLECAYFEPIGIRGTSRRLGIQSDSSYRFERGVDYTLQASAMEHASELLLQIVGGQAGPLLEMSNSHLPVQPTIQLRSNRVNKLIGIQVSDAEIARMLTMLNMQVQENAHGWLVNPPPYRFDLQIEADLVEEIARLYGYNKIPATLPKAQLWSKLPSATVLPLDRTRHLLVDRGFHEVITYSFVDPSYEMAFTPNYEPFKLLNPISSEMAVMRTTLWPGLLQAYQHNAVRQQSRIRLFEVGMCFYDVDNLVQEDWLGGLVAGDALPEQWGTKSRSLDFYDAKADIEALLALTLQSDRYQFVAAEHPALHPGQTAKILFDHHTIGWVGLLHPSLSAKFDIKQNIYLFTLKLSSIINQLLPQFKRVSKYPSVRRDIAVVVDQLIPSQAILNLVSEKTGELLENVQLFDVYSGDGIEAGRKSLAMGITMQHPERTLQDLEVNEVIERVVKALQHNFNATLRK